MFRLYVFIFGGMFFKRIVWLRVFDLFTIISVSYYRKLFRESELDFVFGYRIFNFLWLEVKFCFVLDNNKNNEGKGFNIEVLVFVFSVFIFVIINKKNIYRLYFVL